MFPPEPNSHDRIRALLECLAATCDEEADCLEFDRQQDCLAELIAIGQTPTSVIPPAVQVHLQQSRDCREEFEALITVIKAELASELPEDLTD